MDLWLTEKLQRQNDFQLQQKRMIAKRRNLGRKNKRILVLREKQWLETSWNDGFDEDDYDCCSKVGVLCSETPFCQLIDQLDERCPAQ